MRRVAFRLTLRLLAALLAGPSLGCARSGGFAPQGWAKLPEAGRLASADEWDAALDALFPPLERQHLLGRLTLEGTKIAEADAVDCSFYAEDSRNLRWLARTGDRPLLDVVVRDDQATIVDHRTGRLFQGQDSSETALVRRHFGWHPADWQSALRVGQAAAAGNWLRQPTDAGPALLPADGPADGLERILLDAATGLPREADWRVDGDRWRVRYLAWGLYDDAGQGGSRRLMPRRLAWEYPDEELRLELTVEQYRWSTTPPAGIFTPTLNYRPRRLPLSALAARSEAP